jgi:hypothetical protein
LIKLKVKDERRNPPMTIPQPIILDIESLTIEEEKSKRKNQNQKRP